MDQDQRLWAVVPVKDMAGAKQRLADVLSPPERQALFAAMLEDVLGALAACRRLRGVMLVTRDPHAQDLAARYGARVLVEEENLGHTAATTLGAVTLAAAGVTGMIQVPADIPLVTPADIDAVLDTHGEAPAVTIAPSRDELGSNAVACSPPDVLPLRFGDNSFYPHLERARARGIAPQIVRRPGLALDVDTPADLAAFMAIPSATRAYAYLQQSGITARLAEPAQP